MIGIITAMPSEAELLKEELIVEQKETVGGIDFLTGDIKNSFVCLAVGGIGKVNAAMCAQVMIDRYNVGVIFNCGVAGGKKGEVERGKLVVASALVQHDVDTTAFGDPLGLIPTIETVRLPVNDTISGRLLENAAKLGLEAKQGTVASGDQFVGSSERVKKIHSTFGAVAFEMEAGAIAQVCLRNRVEFVSIKCISDYADEKGAEDFDLTMEEYALPPQRVVYETLK